ncbi:MAG: hypothetical protein MZV70_43890 [Desulfobacterales bacterium]|nr:hypothetical protein [Desulfobacterales bacterium]
MENRGDTAYRSALNSALRILARREHSVFELTQKAGAAAGMRRRRSGSVVAECRPPGLLG